MDQRTVSIVPHTHWDREWYEPFQTFRIKLVEMIDSLLDLLESDLSYKYFLLDGQMAVIDDYLEIRPNNKERIKALCDAGRIIVGPWYILMDEFLVSGETIIRNLQLGLQKSGNFSGAMKVGYLPDMFGHIAQMPQILRLAGIEDAVVWRGVPSEITKTGFLWKAPDGSCVRAEYLPVGYGNGSSLPKTVQGLVQRTIDHEDEIGDFLLADLLYMNGSDHLSPQPFLGKLIADANKAQDKYHFTITSLPEYLRSAPRKDLESWEGELRSGFRSDILMGVTSNRVDVKRSAGLAERALENRAEPLAALLLPANEWPEKLLETAWLKMIQNSAHDSICACSVDDVVETVLVRYTEARNIAQAVAAQALNRFSSSLADEGPVIFNPSSKKRRGLVEVIVPANGPADPNVQVLSERFGLPGTITLNADTIRSVMGMLRGPKIDNDTWITDIKLEEDDEGIDVTVSIGSAERKDLAIAAIKQALYTKLGARPDALVRVRLDQPPTRKIIAISEEIPGFSWQPFAVSLLSHPVELSENIQNSSHEITITNGLVTICVNDTDGTFSLNGLAGFGRLVDEGDFGDSYNYSPPKVDKVIDTPNSLQLKVVDKGPVRGVVEIRANYSWPDHIDSSTQERVGERLVDIVTKIELRADDPLVRISTTFINPCSDHRVRVHFPLPIATTRSRAESSFSIVERGLTTQGRPEEFGLPTFPSKRFVEAGGLLIVHEGVREYELIDIDQDGANSLHNTKDNEDPLMDQANKDILLKETSNKSARTLALTLLRSTSMLSRLGMTYRPLPAGPILPVSGLEMRGKKIEANYALACGDAKELNPFSLADDFLHPLEVVNSLGGGTRPSFGNALCVNGAEVSSIRRKGGLIEIRVYNSTQEITRVSLGSRSGWIVDLEGKPLEQFQESFELGPFKIATVILDETSNETVI